MKNPFNEIKKLAKRIGGNAGRIDDAFRRLDNLPDEIKDQVKNEIQQEIIAPFRNDVLNQVGKLGTDVGRLPAIIEEKAQAAAKEVVSNLSSEALELGAAAAAQHLRANHRAMVRFREKHPDLVAALDDVSVEVNLKAAVSLTLGFDSFYRRAEDIIEVLDEIAQNGLEMRRVLILITIASLLPTSIAVGVEGEFSLGITIGAGVTVGVPAALGIELLDMALEEAGVPE